MIILCIFLLVKMVLVTLEHLLNVNPDIQKWGLLIICLIMVLKLAYTIDNRFIKMKNGRARRRSTRIEVRNYNHSKDRRCMLEAMNRLDSTSSMRDYEYYVGKILRRDKRQRRRLVEEFHRKLTASQADLRAVQEKATTLEDRFAYYDLIITMNKLLKPENRHVAAEYFVQLENATKNKDQKSGDDVETPVYQLFRSSENCGSEPDDGFVNVTEEDVQQLQHNADIFYI